MVLGAKQGSNSVPMNKDIGLDAALYGMAAGAFFWGYGLFEVPSNITRRRSERGCGSRAS